MSRAGESGRRSPAEAPEFAAEVRYRHRLVLQGEFTERLQNLLTVLLSTADISVAQVQGRTKSLDSLVEKIRRKDRYRDPLSEITDLTGIRIVTYYLEDVDRVTALLAKNFVIDVSGQDTHRPEAPGEFGYESSHLVVRLAEQRAHLDEWLKFAGLTAEIQVRTVLQHAWASISHKLIYKREDQTPLPLQRSFARLSALLGVADEQFSSLAVQASQLEETYSKNVSSGELDLPLNPLSVQAYTNASEVRSVLAQIAEQGGWQLLDEASSTAVIERDTHNLLEICQRLNLETVRQLAEAALSQDAPKTAMAIGAQHAADPVEISAQDLLNRLLIVHRQVEAKALRGMYTRADVHALLDPQWDG
ncbi:GTP pyrophosphokinase [Streptomyces sp. 039-1]|uniref:GTP pyrophosphokinase n=1 Tax=Streptomyces sp. 039-1 TaxID=2789263 RepID=UPI0039F5031E